MVTTHVMHPNLVALCPDGLSEYPERMMTCLLTITAFNQDGSGKRADGV